MKTTDSNIETSDFRITFHSSAYVDDEWENWCTCINGDILYIDDAGDQHLAGQMRLFYLDIESALDSRSSLHTLFDIHGETEPFFSLIDPATYLFEEKVVDLVDPELIINLNLLIVSRLELLPPFRGKGVGLSCLSRSVEQYRHGALVALKCFPLQFESIENRQNDWRKEMKFERLSHDYRRSLRNSNGTIERPASSPCRIVTLWYLMGRCRLKTG